ncbi:MAG: beta-lactamase family protein [Piscinibacter sp.]|nr:beta-lactamase family protein [Piscinibacter sp.]
MGSSSTSNSATLRAECGDARTGRPIAGSANAAAGVEPAVKRPHGGGPCPGDAMASALQPVQLHRCAAWCVGILLAVLAACSTAPVAPTIPTAIPEDVGLSGQRLSGIDEFIARMQREQKVAGAVTLVARQGRLVWLRAQGLADLESGRPVRVDDLFQLQSMTKPIVTVAALQLIERGQLSLSDPVERFLPEFADRQVAVAREGAPDGFELVPAVRPMTIADLMTHRAGFAGLPPRDSPGARLQRAAFAGLPANQDFTLEQFVARLAQLPLDAQPGTEFRYGPATDVLGRIIEVVTGQPLDEVLRVRIFGPLRMNDTFFRVPPEQRARIVPAYALKPGLGLVRLPPDDPAPRFISAGGNLFGTATDYLRFCQMLLNGGELGGVRILRRESVELMRSPQVDSIPVPFLPGQSFGLGVAVRKAGDPTAWLGSPGTYGWSGGYNTYFRIDPDAQVVFALFVQLDFSPRQLELQHGFHDAAVRAYLPAEAR